MDLQLKGKTAFVTGASSGIGAAAARILAEEGADVVIAYHLNSKGAQQTAAQVQSLDRRAWLCSLDLANPPGIPAALAEIKAQMEGVDILILCAGHNVITPFVEITPQEWQRVLDVNLNGPFFLVQALAPLFRQGAAIVTVASVAAHTGAPHHPHYAAAKAGLVNLTKSLAREMAPRVRVNCVAPGITLTPMGADTVEALDPNYAEKKLLVQRFATPEEIARWVVLAASPLSGFMTGATIDINGGRDLR